jgi:hypothetical protein
MMNKLKLLILTYQKKKEWSCDDAKLFFWATKTTFQDDKTMFQDNKGSSHKLFHPGNQNH